MASASTRSIELISVFNRASRYPTPQNVCYSKHHLGKDLPLGLVTWIVLVVFVEPMRATFQKCQKIVGTPPHVVGGCRDALFPTMEILRLCTDPITKIRFSAKWSCQKKIHRTRQAWVIQNIFAPMQIGKRIVRSSVGGGKRLSDKLHFFELIDQNKNKNVKITLIFLDLRHPPVRSNLR